MGCVVAPLVNVINRHQPKTPVQDSVGARAVDEGLGGPLGSPASCSFGLTSWRNTILFPAAGDYGPPSLLPDFPTEVDAHSPLVNVILSGIRAHDAGSASGVLSTVQQVGSALGVVIIGVTFFGVQTNQADDAARSVVPTIRGDPHSASILPDHRQRKSERACAALSTPGVQLLAADQTRPGQYGVACTRPASAPHNRR